ncbi:hypothetical protein TNCV_2669281 [Trichonephila clavipes]|nr:hypothetical protein TNCV_2669281 [Trichonephila clavipes]
MSRLKRPPVSVVGKFGEDVSAQVSSSSLVHDVGCQSSREVYADHRNWKACYNNLRDNKNYFGPMRNIL